jgi:anti-anti-sigma factor
MSERLVIDIERTEDTCILRINGRMATGQNEEYLEKIARQVIDTGCRKLLVDIRNLLSTGSAGLSFMLDLHTSIARNAGGRMVLMGPTPHVQEVLEITHLSAVIPSVPDLETATAYLEADTGGVRTAGSR